MPAIAFPPTWSLPTILTEHVPLQYIVTQCWPTEITFYTYSALQFSEHFHRHYVICVFIYYIYFVSRETSSRVK